MFSCSSYKNIIYWGISLHLQLNLMLTNSHMSNQKKNARNTLNGMKAIMCSFITGEFTSYNPHHPPKKPKPKHTQKKEKIQHLNKAAKMLLFSEQGYK